MTIYSERTSIGDVAQKEREGLKFAAAKNAATLGELRKIPAANLIAPDPAVETFTRNCLSGSICIDGRVVPHSYPEALDSGRVADVPVLTGITVDDYGPPADFMNTTLERFVFELPGMFGVNADAFTSVQETYLKECPATNDQEARRMIKRAQVEYRTASVFDWARRRSISAKSPTFTYLFGQAIPWPEHPEFGAFHSSDLIYAFNNLDKMNRPWTDDDRRVADEVSSYWVNFVKACDPNHAGLPVWDSITPDRPATMLLGTKSGPHEIAPPSRLKIYLDLLADRPPDKAVQK